VATDAKLVPGVVKSRTAYDWLKGAASCVVVDEAHTSVGTSYTQILDWQGLGLRQREADSRDIPLIGLTATPFRGTNAEETKRLVDRYGGRRLDLKALGSEDAYPELQRIGILSQVDQELLPGSQIELSDREFDELNTFQRLPESATRKLAADADRNKRLLEHIIALPEDWPILLFAVSVDHAHAMAALLRRAGVSAAAISADTDKGARRHYVERFRRNDLRVLANYNVLAAGFDAPRVRALYIARPTYVPNAYQQMIGRGLRGPRNGGTERCLLVNVADNVQRFEGRLAFHEFDYLWEPDRIERTA
jgi:superfamily II DNA or RNA helicase